MNRSSVGSRRRPSLRFGLCALHLGCLEQLPAVAVYLRVLPPTVEPVLQFGTEIAGWQDHHCRTATVLRECPEDGFRGVRALTAFDGTVDRLLGGLFGFLRGSCFW